MSEYHTVRISHALVEAVGGTRWVESAAWESVARRREDAQAAAAATTTTATPESAVVERPSGTLIVTSRRTRCPKCTRPVERDADAVMMDGTEFGRGPREAFHVSCAEERGWRAS